MKNKILIFILSFTLLFSVFVVSSSAETIPDTVLGKTFTLDLNRSYMGMQGASFMVHGTYEHISTSGTTSSGTFTSIKFGRSGTSQAPGISLGSNYFSSGTLTVTFDYLNDNFYDYTNKYLIYTLYDALDYLIYDTNAYTFNEVPNGGSFTVDAEFVSNNEHWYGLQVGMSSSTPVISYLDENNNKVEVYRAKSIGGIGWLNDNYRDLVFYTSVADIPDTFTYNVLGKMSTLGLFNATLPVPPVIEPDNPDTPVDPDRTTCDGSACPATDANYDNVCDDCMLMFAVPRSYNLYDYNGHVIPVFDFEQVITTSSGDLILGNRYPYAYLFKNGDDYAMYVFDLPLKVDSQNRLVTTQDHVYYYIFKLSSGSAEWRLLGELNEQYYQGVFASSYTGVAWTKTDLKSLDGEVLKQGDPNFPQPPLPLEMVVGEATKGALILQNILKVMKVLIICGIGLLAFLILFGICRKVLFSYLRT